MTLRTSTKRLTFRRPFVLASADGEALPAGEYMVETDEELLQNVSFPAYRRVATRLQLPVDTGRPGVTRTLTVDPAELDVAMQRDLDDLAGEPLPGGPAIMESRHPVNLDEHRGMSAQKSTEIRRRLHDVQADQDALRLSHDEFEKALLAAPAENWHEVAVRADYLIRLFAVTLGAEDTRHQRLVASVLADLARMSRSEGDPS